MKEFVYDFSKKNFNNINEDLVIHLRKKDSIVKYLDEMFKELQRINIGIKYLGFKEVPTADKLNTGVNFNRKKSSKSVQTKEIDRTLYRQITFTFRLKYDNNVVFKDFILNIPEMYDDYFYILNGKRYSIPYQLIDDLTYTNRKDFVAIKTMARTIKLIRKETFIKDVYNDKYLSYQFSINMSKTIPMFTYYFAKFGFYSTFQYFCKPGLIKFTLERPKIKDPIFTYFKFGNFFIRVDRVEFKSNEELKNMIASILMLNKRAHTMKSVARVNYWLLILGSYISSTDAINKGKSLINTFDTSLDSRTIRNIKDIINLDLKSTYSVIRWMYKNFRVLILKKNNMKNIRLRLSEYLVSPVQKIMLTNIYRFLNTSDKINDIGRLMDVFKISPNIIVNSITGKSRNPNMRLDIAQYSGAPNDLTILHTALRYTTAGPGSSMENSNRAKLSIRTFDVSAVGKIDLITTSVANPGVAGVLVPSANVDSETMRFIED